MDVLGVLSLRLGSMTAWGTCGRIPDVDTTEARLAILMEMAAAYAESYEEIILAMEEDADDVMALT